MTARKLKDGLRGANQAEAIVLVAVVRVVVVTVRNRRVVSIVVPTTTAVDAVRARRSVSSLKPFPFIYL